MHYPHHTPDEVEARAEEIYERKIRSKVEASHKGEFVVIDIESEEYEIDQDDLKATQRILKRQPDAVLFGLRVGNPTAYTLGGHASLEQE